MHANALCTAILGAGRRDPDDGAGNRQFGRVIHQRQEHEHFIAESIAAGGGDEDAAIFHVRHESGVKR